MYSNSTGQDLSAIALEHCNFNLDEIEIQVKRLCLNGYEDDAIALLEKIKKFYIQNYDRLHAVDSPFYNHLLSFLAEDISAVIFKESEEEIVEYFFVSKINSMLKDLVHPKPIDMPRYYAFYHWIKIMQGVEPPFQKKPNGQNDAKLIKRFAKEKYRFDDGQAFYRAFTGMDPTNRDAIVEFLGKDYKKRIQIIAKNDITVIDFLRNWPG